MYVRSVRTVRTLPFTAGAVILHETRLTFRIDRSTKQKAILLGINISAICRTAIFHAVSNREKRGQLEIEPVNSKRDAAILFNRIQPVLIQLIKKNPELINDLSNGFGSADVLKKYILQIPDKHFLQFARFVSGDESYISPLIEDFIEANQEQINAR